MAQNEEPQVQKAALKATENHSREEDWVPIKKMETRTWLRSPLLNKNTYCSYLTPTTPLYAIYFTDL